MKSALILGGTRGIGLALANLLRPSWQVVALGRADFDILAPSNQHYFNLRQSGVALGGFDAFVYCAGDLSVTGLQAFAFPEAFHSIVRDHGAHLFKTGCKIIAISSVAAVNPAKLNPDYASAKAALEHYALTLFDSTIAKRKQWDIDFIRFNLVSTDMLKLIPADLRAGRTIISPTEAAQQILERLQ